MSQPNSRVVCARISLQQQRLNCSVDVGAAALTMCTKIHKRKHETGHLPFRNRSITDFMTRERADGSLMAPSAASLQGPVVVSNGDSNSKEDASGPQKEGVAQSDSEEDSPARPSPRASRRGKKYKKRSPEEKLAAVALIVTKGVTHAAEQAGVSLTTLLGWRDKLAKHDDQQLAAGPAGALPAPAAQGERLTAFADRRIGNGKVVTQEVYTALYAFFLTMRAKVGYCARRTVACPFWFLINAVAL
jgi:hypothetical protein